MQDLREDIKGTPFGSKRKKEAPKRKNGIKREIWKKWREFGSVGWNKRKLQILEFIYEEREVTSLNVAEVLGLEIHNARTLLRRYNRQGLLSRYKTDAYGTRVYDIPDNVIIWREKRTKQSLLKILRF